ncbi:fused MFS/spermidine synthase [Terracoccus luteus]|uniref:Spermidine synthase n=1 Tax=Terracoccus luteus TaxID=53356 RepID=A0A839Q6M1_9MICO|nr:fused MFS/spermidine synthase [Terracoccus luteus]MBB2988301.1 spermidine synthase [Terracoccus luteus]MCP2173936.1 spermidine synthase [Terracoccus luteus]
MVTPDALLVDEGPPVTAEARRVDRALPGWLAVVLVVVSSAAVLVLEITSLRLIAPYVGITVETNTGVIGLALAAIALGSWAGGAAADRRPPRAMIGLLLVVGGALVLVVTPAVRLAAAAVGPSDAPSVALLLAGVTVFAPAAVLSAVSPMVVKLQLASLDDTGSVVGRLSSIGTLGAILATFLTGFVLVAVVPTSVILLATGALLVVGGAALVALARRDGIRTSTGTSAALAVALVAAVGCVAAPSPCDVETTYHCASVRPDPARPGGQVLVLDTLRHSYVDPADPTYLEFGYAKTFAAALDTLPDTARDVLHVGGGGMTLPRYLLDQRPDITNTVVEIDPGVVDVDRTRLALPDDPRLRVDVGDGRVAVAQLADDSVDAYVGDAFGGVAVPWHLTTRETFADVARVLRPGGLVVLNVIDFGPLDFARSELATVASVFAHTALAVVPGSLEGAGGNLVIIASDRPLDREALTRALVRQASPMTLVEDADVAALVAAAPMVLRDDHAPVDQLLTTTRTRTR